MAKRVGRLEKVCRHLGGIPVELVDLSKEYWVNVFEPALDDWQSGTTPNPDVNCNREIKFGALMDKVLGSQREDKPKTWLATGHYGHVEWSNPTDSSVYPDSEFQPRPRLLRAKDRSKVRRTICLL
ncbi:hypothetical protein L7F22_047689 [Adiantum nelumboides]|nr:hypothetical protein [Adiantum nelumboides]